MLTVASRPRRYKSEERLATSSPPSAASRGRWRSGAPSRMSPMVSKARTPDTSGNESLCRGRKTGPTGNGCGSAPAAAARPSCGVQADRKRAPREVDDAEDATAPSSATPTWTTRASSRGRLCSAWLGGCQCGNGELGLKACCPHLAECSLLQSCMSFCGCSCGCCGCCCHCGRFIWSCGSSWPWLRASCACKPLGC